MRKTILFFAVMYSVIILIAYCCKPSEAMQYAWDDVRIQCDTVTFMRNDSVIAVVVATPTELDWINKQLSHIKQ